MTKARVHGFHWQPVASIHVFLLFTIFESIKHKKGNLTRTACCVTVAACYIKGLYKIREYTMNKKT